MDQKREAGTVKLPCLRCNGDRWLRVFLKTPAWLYGEPRTVQAAVICPGCRGTGTITPIHDGKAAAAGED